MTLPEMLENSARRFAKRKALIFGARSITYSQLNERVNKISQGLRELGVKKGERIALLLGNCPEFIIGYFAILKTGAIVVPLNNMLKIEELKFILQDCEATTLITSLSFIEMATQLRLRIESLKRIVVVDDNQKDTINFSDMLNSNLSLQTYQDISSDEVAVIIYTSGTTGHPKGAILTHKNLISNVTSSIQMVEVDSRDNFLCLLPMFHSFTSTVCILMPLYVGAKITIMESIRPFEKVLKSILKDRVTVLVGIPQIFKLLAEAPVPHLLTLPLFRWLNPLRFCISGADKLSVEVLNKFQNKFHLPLLEGYGLTEASPVVSVNPLKGKKKAGSVGPPISGVEVKVVDEEGRKLPYNSVGELIVKGPNVMKGYFHLTEATGETIKDGWLYTGDLARIDEDGYIYIVDRKKDLIIIHGLNVYPREVEDVIYLSPKVAEAAVVGIKDEHHGEVPKAYVALKEGESATEHEIIHLCRDRLAAYKVPRTVEFRKSLPKTSTGKILKRDLRYLISMTFIAMIFLGFISNAEALSIRHHLVNATKNLVKMTIAPFKGIFITGPKNIKEAYTYEAERAENPQERSKLCGIWRAPGEEMKGILDGVVETVDCGRKFLWEVISIPWGD